MAIQGHAIAGCTGLKMKVVLRADASLQIGTGHVMRCLTLADALAGKGAECQFICRAHEGNLIEFIRSKGYPTHALPVQAEPGEETSECTHDSLHPAPTHSHWLGATQDQDAQACAPILRALQPGWLIVDHYALDARWEQTMAAHRKSLMVIDDLADRPHACDLLLDQTFGRDAADYRSLVPAHCRLLCGSEFALLRPEFSELRPYSLRRRAKPVLRELLITMGGIDQNNATEQVLQALRSCPLPTDCRITVVMGSSAPWLDVVRAQAQNMPWPTRVLVGVSDMAQLMADSDLAIGAAGATSWERCCLGLPTAMLVLADNQQQAARLLQQVKAVVMLDLSTSFNERLAYFISEILNSAALLSQLSDRASKISDGKGSERVADMMTLKGSYDT